MYLKKTEERNEGFSVKNYEFINKIWKRSNFDTAKAGNLIFTT